MRTFFNKHKYLREVVYNNDKSVNIRYHKRANFNPKYLVNPNHVFNFNGYSTIVTHENATESINPLDFTSKYDAKVFRSAINNKLIDDTFNTLKVAKYDLQQIMLMLSLVLNGVILYLLLKTMEII